MSSSAKQSELPYVHGVLPIFPQEIAKSHALNSSPYLLDIEVFDEMFTFSEPRKTLIKQLRSVLIQSIDCHIRPFALLVGGSFLKRDVGRPKDFDCICFYECPDLVANTAGLIKLRDAALKLGVDIRFVPYDANPIIALKVCSFFTSLYTAVKRAQQKPQGCVMVKLGDFNGT